MESRAKTRGRCQPLWVTRGAACPVAPAKEQNNQQRLPSPRQGPRIRGMRAREPQASLGATPKGARVLCREQGPCISHCGRTVWLPSPGPRSVPRDQAPRDQIRTRPGVKA